MNRMDRKTRRLVILAIIAAVYAALTIALGFMAYGPIQFRIAEVLCILPFFFPSSVWGLAVGCVLANLVGGYGPIDIIFGSLATVLAGLCTAQIGKSAMRKLGDGESVSWWSCIAACAMPVVFNAPIIGAVISYCTMEEYSFWQGTVVYGAQVGFGEAVVMLVLGLSVLRIFLKNDKMLEMFKSF